MSEFRTDYIKIAKEVLEESNLLLRTEEGEEYTTLLVRIPSRPGPSMLSFIKMDDSGFFSYCCYPVYDLEDEKLVEGMLLANMPNDEYRFFKNFVDSEGDYNIRYECFLIGDEDQVKEQVASLILLFTNLLQAIIPQVMTLITVDPYKKSGNDD